VQQPQDHGGSGAALTVVEAAAFLKVKSSLVYRLLNSGEMPGIRVGGVWRISRSQLERWLEGSAS